MNAVTLASPARPMLMPPPVSGTPVPPSPFALAPQRDDTALFQDARTAFSHLLPGRPALGVARPDEADAVVHLQDAPVTIRYRLAPPGFAAASALEAARGTAERHAAFRARVPVAVENAEPSWLACWGVEAAAVARYDVAADATHEDLFVLARQGLVLTMTWTYPRGFAEDPAYAAFASVAEATMIWDPARWEQKGRVWPDSPFHGAGLFPPPKPKYNESAKQVAAAHIAQPERVALLAVLADLVSRAGAPWVLLPLDTVASAKAALLDVARNPAVRAFVERAFLDVKTAHDLRGLAVQLGRALDQRR